MKISPDVRLLLICFVYLRVGRSADVCQSVRVDIAFLFDISGSLEGHKAQLQKFSEIFINYYIGINRTATANGTGSVDLAVIAFGADNETRYPKMLKTVRRFNSIVPIGDTGQHIKNTTDTDMGGGTPIAGAMEMAWKLFNQTGRNDSYKAMFVVSDGIPMLRDGENQTEEKTKVKNLKPKLEADNITIYGLFLGDADGSEFMKSDIVSNESFFFQVEDITNATTMDQKLGLVVTGMCKDAAEQQSQIVVLAQPESEIEETTTTSRSAPDGGSTTGPSVAEVDHKAKSTGFPVWAMSGIGVGCGLLLVVLAASSLVLYNYTKRLSKGFSGGSAVKDVGIGVDIS